MSNGTSSSTLVDEDGRDWVWDSTAKVWYAPDWGLEFASRQEIDESYGIVSESSGS